MGFFEDQHLQMSLKNLFKLKDVPCDTQMRVRLDPIDPDVTRPVFTRLFARLQRGKILENFQFLGKYLISLDGTQYFNSSSVHCKHCCTREHKNGQTTYHHQILGAALVHPDQRIVFPFAPEPIIKSDGDKKNDCERNAAKRWVDKFRREHFLLPAIIVADGLSSNEPFITHLRKNRLSFILTVQEDDHKYLFDWLNAADEQDAPIWEETIIVKGKERKKGKRRKAEEGKVEEGKVEEEKKNGIRRTYQYIKDVPLNATKDRCRVNVVRCTETKGGKTTTWVWVTDLEVNKEMAKQIATGGRCRWKIENETFNTLKNQGYNFEHNYGHGNQHLSILMAYIMLLIFFIDQILQGFDKGFQACYAKMGSKSGLWERMRSFLTHYVLESFDSLYAAIVHPPPKRLLSDAVA